MSAVAIGPLVFAADRLAAILALAVLVLLAQILGRRAPRLAAWGWWAALAFALGARAGHVLDHLPGFVAAPWRIFAFWQGGFKPASGVVAAIVLSVIYLRAQPRLLLRAAACGAAAAAVALTLLLRSGGLAPTALPEQSFALLDGGTLAPASLAGQPVVVNLWASWCPPCRREMPMLAEAARQRRDVAFLFVNQRESPQQVRRFLSAAQVALPAVVLDPAGEFARHYAAIGLPVTLFVGADGVLKAAQIGEISAEVLDARLAELLAAESQEGTKEAGMERVKGIEPSS